MKMSLDELYKVLVERAGYQSERASKLSMIEGWKKSIAMVERDVTYLDQKISDLETRIA
jgi:hypothetical protein